MRRTIATGAVVALAMSAALATSTAPLALGVPTQLAADAFARTSTNSWGTADVGGPWSLAGRLRRSRFQLAPVAWSCPAPAPLRGISGRRVVVRHAGPGWRQPEQGADRRGYLHFGDRTTVELHRRLSGQGSIHARRRGCRDSRTRGRRCRDRIDQRHGATDLRRRRGRAGSTTGHRHLADHAAVDDLADRHPSRLPGSSRAPTPLRHYKYPVRWACSSTSPAPRRTRPRRPRSAATAPSVQTRRQ